jgi:4-hydroxy-tetrahydrodipicolinate reductase
VGFDGEHDVVSLRHRARGRGGFSLGAVLAGEWIVGRRGAHDFEEVLDDLLKKGGSQ